MATNGHYAAYTRHGKVYLEALISSWPGQEAQCLPLPPILDHSVPSLSTLQPHLLAISRGSQILVYNATEGRLRQTISGNGRVVTALNWSPLQANLLCSGAIDGSLSLWDLESTGSAIAQVKANGVCRAIACCPTDSKVIAAVHDGKTVIYKHVSKTCLRPVRTLALEGDDMTSISWHPLESGRLLTAAQSGQVSSWDLSAVLNATATQDGNSDGYSSDNEDGFFGKLEDVQGATQQVLDVSLEGPLLHAQWAGKNAFFCLSCNGTRCSVWSWEEAATKAVELWSVALEHSASFSFITRTGDVTFLGGVSRHGVERMLMPEAVAKEIGIEATADRDTASKLMNADYRGDGNTNDAVGMVPILIPTSRASNGSFAKTSKQLQHRKPSFERKREMTVSSTAQLDAGQIDPPSPPPPISMTSSLELPKQRDEEGSPMPFLSPSIPSRKASPGDLSLLDDSINLPPLPRASFDSSAQSTSAPTQESDDSDDETFVDGMQGSASFLPGGINVPLPKACAALFTPTGELLTFFPPKPKLASRRGDAVEERQADPKANAKKVARLFPNFGNLAGEPQLLNDDDDSGFESTSSVSADAGPLRVQPSFSFYPSSFPSQQSWKSRISPTKHSFTEQSPHKVIVRLHDINGIGPLLPASRQLASHYRILCDAEETGADLCHHNAEASEMFGLDDTACVWRLIAILLEGQVPLETFSSGRIGDDILIVARAASELAQNGIRRPASRRQHYQPSGKLRWADNPFGSDWVVRAVFEWAEACADMQLLAVLSAILADTQEDVPMTFMIGQGLTTHLPSYQHDYFSSARATEHRRRLTNQSIPILRTNSVATSNAVYESPVKLKRSSTTSSRNPSQPPTPYLGSESSTPPFSLPTLGRQSTRLSISGSISPEHHRSSFSAAAKYYAQSISDKFASYGAYGTSPPARKMDSSPSNTNELSTSFPSGSWGKSVSFASTTSTTRASLLSTSYEGVQEDEGYDSDKTVEDLSLPQTPKDSSECVVTLKNDRLFDDDVSGGSRARLISDDMIEKCRLWCDYYAEQLRCWDLLAQAAELDKVCGMTCLRKPSEYAIQEETPGIVPTTASNGTNACSICSIKMTGAQTFCPQCYHSAHPGCMEDFIKAMCKDGDEKFACPAGCGCQCDDLPLELAESEKEDRPRKKASFTDPRRWRARVEGDSW